MKQLFLLLAAIPTFLLAQDYKASLIPDSLLTNANAVQRFEEVHVMIKGIDKAIVKRKWAVTVLNEDGERYASYSENYNKLITLSDISGKLFDADGKVLQKIKKKDIADLSATDDETLLSDDRRKKFAFYCRNYPYTVEFEEEQELNGIYSLPVWTPSLSGKYAVQQSRFIVEAPNDYKLRYKQFNYSGNPVISTNNATTSYVWEVTNKPAFLEEMWQPPMDELFTLVYIAPTTFSISGYTGDMSSWDGLGKFQLALNKGRNELPENIKQEVHRIADGLPTKEEKVKALYKYLQQNTRYISIQLGIGGWQPLEARFVAEKKFGDCKALSNYMVSLLKEAGIKASYVIVRAGADIKEGLLNDFPSPYFNHVIACVPDVKDTIWLECTSQTMSAGFMGSFTGDRKALMITDTGGVVVSTPRYPAEVNIQVTKANATISDDGTLVAEVNTRSTGLQEEDEHDHLHHLTQKERDDYYNHKYELPTYKVENISYKETEGRIPAMDEHITITSPHYASITGKRLFIQPNLFNKQGKLSTDKPRKFDIVYPYSYKDIDSISLAIPKGYKVESMPKEVSIANKFGVYSISYKVRDNSIELVRVHQQSESRFPASDYLDMARFYEEKNKADHARIVFVKNE